MHLTVLDMLLVINWFCVGGGVWREGMQLLFLTDTIYLLDLASVWGQVVTVPYLYLLDFKSVGRQSYNISTRYYICMGGSEPFFSFR